MAPVLAVQVLLLWQGQRLWVQYQRGLVPGPGRCQAVAAYCSGCWPASGQCWIWVCSRVPEFVLVYQWAEPCPRVVVCEGRKGPGLVPGCWAAKSPALLGRGRTSKWCLPLPISYWQNKLPKMAVATVYIFRVSTSCLLSPREAFQDQQVGLTQAPFKLLPLLGLGLCEVLRMPCKNTISISQSPLAPCTEARLAFKARHLGQGEGLVFQVQSLSWGAGYGPRMTCPLGRRYAIEIILFVGYLSRGMGLDYTMFLPLLPIALWFLLYIFTYRKFFLLVFRSFPQMDAMWCAQQKMRTQGPPTPPSWPLFPKKPFKCFFKINPALQFRFYPLLPFWGLCLYILLLLTLLSLNI